MSDKRYVRTKAGHMTLARAVAKTVNSTALPGELLGTLVSQLLEKGVLTDADVSHYLLSNMELLPADAGARVPA